MAENAKKDDRPKLDGIQKAAILLISLGPTEGGLILKNLREDEADRLAKAIARLEAIDQDQVEEALEEYSLYVTSQKLLVRGGIDYAKKMLIEAYGPELAGKLLARITKSLESDLSMFENFRKADPQQLAKFIQDEHPQTIAVILSHLDPAQSARLMSALPAELHREIAVRMAELDEISPEVLRNIAVVIDQKLRNLGALNREQLGGVRAVADMFNRLDPKTCAQLLTALETDNPVLFESVRKFMFVFRDLENLDEAAIKILITKVDRKALMLALKGANETLRDKFIKTQSSRGAEMMTDDLASMGPVKLSEVDAAQQQIIATARELEKDGSISLSAATTDQMVY